MYQIRKFIIEKLEQIRKFFRKNEINKENLTDKFLIAERKETKKEKIVRINFLKQEWFSDTEEFEFKTTDTWWQIHKSFFSNKSMKIRVVVVIVVIAAILFS